MFNKIKLNYKSLEPYIDDETLYINYNKIYGKYIEKLNYLIEKGNYNFTSLLDIVQNIDKINLNDRGEILYNLGAVLNHSIYFSNMSNEKNNIPINELKEKIDNTYGSYNNFKKEFKKSALNLVGSGYTFLVLDNNNLKIINLSNEDSPYFYNYIPLISLDLWEHAYFLKYKTDKESYIDSWFNLLDYKKINELYKKNIK